MKSHLNGLAVLAYLVFSLGMAMSFRGTTILSVRKAFPVDTVDLDSTRIGISTVASGENAVWEMVWGPDNHIWFTDQDGKVSRLNPETGTINEILQIKDYYRKRLGLMSMVLHPDWKKHPHVFINYSHIRSDSTIVSKLVRYTYDGRILKDPALLYEIPGYLGHNGSRLVISKDKKILWATGDLKQKETIHNPKFTNGKVLRLNLDGTIPADNPYPGSPAWSMGFRVPQGLTYTATGNLFIAEHGDATDDEVNLVTKAGHYGWPYVAGFCDLPEEQGYCAKTTTIMPVKAWTPTIAPAGMDYYNGNITEWKNALLLSTLKDQSLRILHLDAAGTNIVGEDIMFSKQFGRLRDVCVSPSGDIYLATSNRDWNPPANFPIAEDDRIIRISRIGSIPGGTAKKVAANGPTAETGATLYTNFCESCHKPDGRGVPGSFPSLVGSVRLAGKKDRLVAMLLKGGQATTGEAMPSFRFLSDAQLSQLAAHVKSRFAPQLPAITGEDFRQARKMVH
jgi:glucose/arabinose dehydrogenase/mono/diheme cytochrome c family protein